jgi:hypothetical protein
MIIRFTPEADAELAEARQWYAHQREDLDLEFMKGSTMLCRVSRTIPGCTQLFTERSDVRLFGVSRSLCFMKFPELRFR